MKMLKSNPICKCVRVLFGGPAGCWVYLGNQSTQLAIVPPFESSAQSTMFPIKVQVTLSSQVGERGIHKWMDANR